MQVDNPIRQSSWDVGDLFHSDLFSTVVNGGNAQPTPSNPSSGTSTSLSPHPNHATSSASSPSSREATPLPTTPSISPGDQFPDHHTAHAASTSNLQSPDDLFAFYDSDRPATSASARELLNATGPKSPSFGFGGMGLGGGMPFGGSFPMDDADFNAYMTGLEETYGITNTSDSSPTSSSSATSPQQGQGQAQQHPQGQQQGMGMMFPFNNMDLEMMSLPMSLDGTFGSMTGSNDDYGSMSMMGMTIDSADSSNGVHNPLTMGTHDNIGIDPQLVDSPAPLVAMDDDSPSTTKEEEEEEAEEAGVEREGDDGDDEEEFEAVPLPAKRGRKRKVDAAAAVPAPTASGTRRSARKSNAASPSPMPTSPSASAADKEKLTLTIAPVKVGGRGTALGRRGTVISGGITKRGTAIGSSVTTSALATPSVLSERGNTPAPTPPAKRGRKAGAKKSQEQQEPQAQQLAYVPPPVVAQTLPVTSTSGLSVVPAPPTATVPATTSVTASSASSTHSRTASTSKAASKLTATTPIGIGIPHSSSGLGIVPPPLPNGQRHLTPVDLGLGKTFAFAIPMGTFNGGVSGVVPPAQGSVSQPSPLGTNSTTAPVAQAPATATAGASTSHSTPVSNRAMSEFGDEEDDDLGSLGNGKGAYPADWRPSPEVFAKMTSKEKRQLRNKISARNFRVRRKEYISTLEGDIAERDRLLEAIRNELGSSRNENLALRREVENLKKVLLEGRGANATSLEGTVLEHLPPPAPLPEKSAAEVLAAQAAAQASASTPSTPAFKPNTQKDLPTSPRNGTNSFWGGGSHAGGMNGMFGAGGVTAVHTTFVPAPVVVGLGTGSASPNLASIGGFGGLGGVGAPNLGALGAAWTQPSPFAPALQENMNPLLRSAGAASENTERRTERQQRESVKKGVNEQKENSFEGFADSNMFTMKNLDAYRMHLWGKMAAQYHAHHQQQQRAAATPQQQQHQASPRQDTPDSTANVYHPNLFQMQQLVHQQQLAQQQYQQSQLQGLAARMGRSWFSSPSTPSTPSDTRAPLGNTTNLVALLSGKGSVPGSSGYAGTGFKKHPSKVAEKGQDEKVQLEQQKNQLELAKKMQQQQQEQAQAAMLAVVASQTILRKLGQAFWDAFSGSSSSSSTNYSSTSPSSIAKRFEAPRSTSSGQAPTQRADWDADKVRKVLDGTAVLRIVDVDQLHKLDGPSASAVSATTPRPAPTRSTTTVPVPSPTLLSKQPSSCAPACSWTKCSREWCSSSTEALRNVSKGGSVSVPGSPVIRAAGPGVSGAISATGHGLGGALNGKLELKEEKCKVTALLEESMKGLRL